MNAKQKVALVILDGWGIGDHSRSDAIYHARTPFTDSLNKSYPHSTLLTFGEHVGLPEGQMGNSEVGHMNIGAGRVVWQQLVLINKAFREGQINTNPVLTEAFSYAKSKGKQVHLMGLMSDGGVHSSMDHAISLCHTATRAGVEKLFVHAFLDGRDTDPKSGSGYLERFIKGTENSNARIASVIGRYYAMDRDKRWERVKLAYDLLVHGKGTAINDPVQAVLSKYEEGITDEFMSPLVVTGGGKPLSTVQPGDVVICFNFRTDRGREITMALTQQPFPEQQMDPLPLHYVTLTEYDKTFKDVKVVFPNIDLGNTLGEVIASNRLTQVRAAETEKYPHVTFFFSGGRELPFKKEKRVLIASPKVATYDLQPEMSALPLRDAMLEEFEKSEADFLCINFANPDMVGHTGVYEAIVKAVETVDSCLEALVKKGLEKNYTFIIIADHGNADYAINEDGTPNTAHSMNPVPFWLVEPVKKHSLRNGKLADIAPTILTLMGLQVPAEMTGEILVSPQEP